jgi:hypothetical protein
MKDEKPSQQNANLGPVALTLGVISIVAAFFYYVTIPAGVLAIIFGARASRRPLNSKTGRAGMILGIIGLALFLLIYASVLILLVLANYT